MRHFHDIKKHKATMARVSIGNDKPFRYVDIHAFLVEK